MVKNEGKIAILMFSHGAIVNSYTEILDYGRKLPTSCSYCAITAMVVKNQKSNLEFKVYTDHLKNKPKTSKMLEIDTSKMTEEEK